MNFGLRFFYEFFLEVIVCVLINFFSYGAQANESWFLWSLNLLLGLSVLAFIGFVVRLFFKGGPYTTPSSYKKDSLKASIWGKRELCIENCDLVLGKQTNL